MPIRTGLDDRLKVVRDELKLYFAEAGKPILMRLKHSLN